jgi:hypothetical protein
MIGDARFDPAHRKWLDELPPADRPRLATISL